MFAASTHTMHRARHVAASLLILMLGCASASAQQASQCPSLPTGSPLRWEQQAQSDLVICKAIAEDGREVLSMVLTARDPDLSLNRALREEKGSFAGENLYWHRPDLGGQKPAGYETRRIAVVKLDKNHFAQISLYASDAQELGTLQSLTQGMNTNPTALAGSR